MDKMLVLVYYYFFVVFLKFDLFLERLNIVQEDGQVGVGNNVNYWDY